MRKLSKKQFRDKKKIQWTKNFMLGKIFLNLPERYVHSSTTQKINLRITGAPNSPITFIEDNSGSETKPREYLK